MFSCVHSLSLPRDEIDNPHKKKAQKVFRENFSVQLFFEKVPRPEQIKPKETEVTTNNGTAEHDLGSKVNETDIEAKVNAGNPEIVIDSVEDGIPEHTEEENKGTSNTDKENNGV